MSDDSFLREVEEELRSDKLKAFWRRFAPFIIGGAVLIVVLVAANEAYKWWRDSTAATASDAYYTAAELARSEPEAARVALEELAQSGAGGYEVLARFRAAALLAEEGDAAGAIAAYDSLSNSVDNRRLRELAFVLAGYLAVDHLDVAAVEARVGALTGPESAFRNQAREALGLAHFKAGEFTEARALFEEMAADANASQEVQIRAFVYLEQLASTGVSVDAALLDGGAEQDGLVVPELPLE